MISKGNDFHSTDEFMFQTFNMHSKIFRQKNLRDYFMISSGTNQFSMPCLWKESMIRELESDFLYRWYTASDGFQCITTAIKIYEDYVSSMEQDNFVRSDRKVCMATGGSGAASMVFEYFLACYKKCCVVLVGMNYSLYERLAKKHHFSIIELCDADDPYGIPSVNDFKKLEACDCKYIFIFSLPNNPTGDMYSYQQFSDILSIIANLNGFVVLDQVCNIVISESINPLFEKVVTQLGLWESCAVVNSFSKSEAAAGLRIGYVYGTEKLIQFCSTINADSIMNPPTFPAFPIVVTCMFRCIYISKMLNDTEKLKEYFFRLFSRLFYYTSAIIPPEMREYTESFFEKGDERYFEYINEQLENEKIMKHNYKKTIDIFYKRIDRVSVFKSGFNFCIWFNLPFKWNEISLIEKLIENTGVAIMTESSFSIRNSHENQYFIRFSSACDATGYDLALKRMADYLETEGFYK